MMTDFPKDKLAQCSHASICKEMQLTGHQLSNAAVKQRDTMHLQASTYATNIMRDDTSTMSKASASIHDLCSSQ